ncbi:hypothetical protein OSB04_026186 [Centaurea solstitialis]|uniref:Pectinesterase catalytic domain-containing protein n=1 Tax=Centaurea solstitialis TaxID=347529 RepID=A0AA38SP03_9ASTR|nr:hypothetical protein OSB04_026186 [Centaurea solstitialis]
MLGVNTTQSKSTQLNTSLFMEHLGYLDFVSCARSRTTSSSSMVVCIVISGNSMVDMGVVMGTGEVMATEIMIYLDRHNFPNIALILTTKFLDMTVQASIDDAPRVVWGSHCSRHNIPEHDRAGQALTLLSISDQSIFYHCCLKRYRDTLFTYANKELYKES